MFVSSPRYRPAERKFVGRYRLRWTKINFIKFENGGDKRAFFQHCYFYPDQMKDKPLKVDLSSAMKTIIKFQESLALKVEKNLKQALINF